MSDESASRISEAELEIMKVLWEAEKALSVTEIRERLFEGKGWEPTTVKTLITRLCRKGALRQEKKKVFYYAPLISRKEYDAWATHDLIKRLYNGSARALVSALVTSDGLTKADIDELKRMFDEGDKK
ncbi:MAG: BlaI/MecI/CopY family transcriptional regulator [Clostridia bacterium]|nr:BlaI/MecI/CopY family transcriptional regulator [Clostridia bacterium]